MALLCPLSLPTIQDLTMKRVGSLTLEAWLIRSVGFGHLVSQDKGICDTSGRVELVWGFGKCFTGQIQCKYTVHSCGISCEERGGGSPAMQGLPYHILGFLTRIPACPLCPINKCTFVWHNFSPKKLVFKLVMNFEKFVH